jgi:hypothetical protein
MNAPALHIVLALEARPRVFVDCLDEGDKQRLEDWLDLAREEKAA